MDAPSEPLGIRSPCPQSMYTPSAHARLSLIPLFFFPPPLSRLVSPLIMSSACPPALLPARLTPLIPLSIPPSQARNPSALEM